MRHSAAIAALLAVLAPTAAFADDAETDMSRDILVTLDDTGASIVNSGVSAPYRKRKRYSTGARARRQAAGLARDYAIVEVDRWPIRSLAVFCFVYRVDPKSDRQQIVERLRADPRVESAQPLQHFETLANERPAGYDDTYTGLQRGLGLMDIPAAHRYSRGRGVRVAIVDSNADAGHEDLEGQVKRVRLFTGDRASHDADHGTAVASVIGATANNAKGIVGIAPEAVLDVYAACWADDRNTSAICDSFTLAKALDSIAQDTPDVLNLSLVGPYDPLLARLLGEIDQAGIVAIAAYSSEQPDGHDFPASLAHVIGVRSSDRRPTANPASLDRQHSRDDIYAPGDQIMVAIPDNAYDFRSGDSLATAHVSGIVALLLSLAPKLHVDAVRTHLRESQQESAATFSSVNACRVLQRIENTVACP